MQSESKPQFSFHHVGVAVVDIEASRRVFADAFGFADVCAVVDVLAQQVRTCFIEAAPGTYFELVQGLTSDSPMSHRRGPYHLCFSVTDLEMAINHLRKHKFVVLQRFSQQAMGMGRWAYVLGPDRSLVELCEPVHAGAAG